VTWEVVAAALLAGAVLWLVIGPLVRPARRKADIWEPPEPEETTRGVALSALREIEFDRETGKLSDADYTDLKTRYTREAVAALRAEGVGSGPATELAEAPRGRTPDIEAMIAARARTLRGQPAPPCRTCGPRPEPDAVFCSDCGRRLDTGHNCAACGAVLAAGTRFCEACGATVAA